MPNLYLLKEEKEEKKEGTQKLHLLLESTTDIPSTTKVAPERLGETVSEVKRTLPQKIIGEAKGIAGAGVRDIKEIVSGLPKAIGMFGDIAQIPRPQRDVVVGKLVFELAKAQGQRYKDIYKHPVTELRERPVSTALDLSLLWAPVALAGKAGILGKVAKGVGLTKPGALTQKAFARPLSYEPAVQKVFRRTYGKIGMGRIRGVEEAEKLYRGFTPAERLRLGQIIKGGITTKENFATVAKSVKNLREDLAQGLRGRGLLGEETFLTKLPKKRVAELTEGKNLLEQRLDVLKTLRDTPVQNRQKLLTKLKGLEIQRKKHMGELREIKSLERWKDVDLDVLARRLSIEGLDNEIRAIRQSIIAKRPYKGLAKDIQKLEGRVGEVNTRLYQHYHYGGWMEYMPREYLKHVENKTKILQAFNPKKYRVRTPWQKGRKEIPEEVRMAMGEVLEPSYPMYMAITRESRAIATYDLFQDIAKNPKWASSTPAKDWVQITKTENLKTLGDLAGKWVRPDIADEINAFGHVLSPTAKFYQKWLSLWKFGKVVPRMGTHMRNIYNNLIFLDFAGLSPFNPKSYVWMGKAIKDLKGKGAYSQKLMKEGLLGTEYAGTEIMPLFTRWLSKAGKKPNLFDDVADLTKGGINKLAELYRAEDQVFKVATAMFWDKKVGWRRALKEVDLWWPNYREVPKVTKFLRESPVGAPFFSFKSEALRIAKNASIHHPVKLAKWTMMPALITDTSARLMGMSESQVDRWRKTLPEWVNKGMYAMVPSSKGDPRALDLTYIMFLGDLTEGADPRHIFSNPVFTIPYALVGGREAFSDRKISRPGFTTEETMMAWTNMLTRNLAPSFPLIPGSTDYEKLRKSLLKKPHPYTGKAPPLGWTLLDVMGGIRTRTFGKRAEREAGLRRRQKAGRKDLKSEIYYIQRRKDLTIKEKRKKIRQLQEKIREIWKKD